MHLNSRLDYYEVLSVGRDASDQDIKSAYRKLALQYHPDRNPERKEECTERFKEITEAYSVLADPQKRAAYDRFGHAGLGGNGQPDFSSTIFADFGDIFGNFGDLFGFGDVFGQARTRRRGAERGADLRYDLQISFEEAAAGLETKIKIPRMESCPDCGGRGAKRGSHPVTCSLCGGRGQVRQQQGFFTLSQTCPQCRGAGQIIQEPCPSCRGEGRRREERVLSIKIPAGVEDGMRLRVSGEGEAGLRGGPAGDLYVVLRVREHQFFERQGNDLYITIPISLAQAALGTDLKVPTLKGQEKLHVPEGTQPNTLFRLRGLGVPNVEKRGQGDLYVKVQVIIPTRLSREQRHILESMAPGVRVENKPLKRTAGDKTKDNFG
ncbi:MAG: molecular chaperone DnaJ [Acidobacteriota bacterium]|nr:molecular chaperone DnaJ [Acidobacteriota bacterium]